MLQLQHLIDNDTDISSYKRKHPSTEDIKYGWALFPDELAWYIYDFFTFALNSYEKLVFYGFYIVGFTYEELGESLHCSHQNAAYMVERINERVKLVWETRDKWRVEDDSQFRDKRNRKKYKRRNK